MKQIYITDDCEYKELIEGSETNKNNAKTAYKTAVDANIRNFNLRVICGTEEYTTSDIGSIKITSDLFGTDTFTLGSAVSETLDITIFRYCDSVDTGSPIIPFISLRTEVEIQTDIGVETQEVWQEVCMGMFYVVADGVTDDGYNTTTIRASSIFSNPDFGDKVFESSTSSNLNRDLYNIIDHILDDVNHSVSPNIYLLNDDLPDVSISDESGNIIDRPYKEIIEYIARLYGGYAKTYYDKDTNKVYLKFFRLPIGEDTGYFYDKSNYMSFKRSKDFLNIQKISCTRGENDVIWVTQASSGTGETSSDGYRAIYIECADMTPELLSEIFNYYHGYTYHPMTSKIFGSPVLEVGDRITIRGRGTQAVGAEMPLHKITYNITGSGLTMDIQSVYKVNPVTAKKTVKSTLNDMNGRQDTLEEEMSLLKEKVEQLESGSGSSCDCGDRLDSVDTNISNLTTRVSNLEKEVTNLWAAIGEEPSPGTGTLTNPIEFYVKKNGANVLAGKVGASAFGNTNSGTDETCCYIHSSGGYPLKLGMETDEGDGEYDDDSYQFPIVINPKTHVECGYGYKGLSLREPVILGKIKIGDDTRMDSYNGTSEPNNYNPIGYGEIFGAARSLIISGQNRLDFELHPQRYTNSGGTDREPLMTFECTKLSSLTCKGTLYVDFDGNNHITFNMRSIGTTSAQTDYTSSLINGGSNENMMYNDLSYYDGELRWCWKENVFTYPECDVDPETDEWIYTGRNICYIELPIFMAENIQNDYHINVSKMSWGDYRIIEKNPYYFILESQEEDFAFTFEVVAKLNDNQTTNNNAIIANEGYEVLAEVNED